MKKQKNIWAVLAGWEAARRLVYGELLLLGIFLTQMQDGQERSELHFTSTIMCEIEISTWVVNHYCF